MFTYLLLFIYLSFFQYIKCQNVIIFSAWRGYIEEIQPRIRHFIDYTTLHNYRFILFTDNHVDEYKTQKEQLFNTFTHTELEFIHVTETLKFTPGWLKVRGFKYIMDENTFNDTKVLLYVDMDVLFYNMAVDLASVIDVAIKRSNTYEIFNQQYWNDRFHQTHAVLFKKTNITARFVNEWWAARYICPDVAMEQGAYNLIIALWHNLPDMVNPYIKSEDSFDCHLKHCIIGSKTSSFNDCQRKWMITNGFGHGTYRHKYIFWFTNVLLPNRKMNDGFSSPCNGYTYVDLGEGLMEKKSCPLIYHPSKSYKVTVTANHLSFNCSKWDKEQYPPAPCE